MNIASFLPKRRQPPTIPTAVPVGVRSSAPGGAEVRTIGQHDAPDDSPDDAAVMNALLAALNTVDPVDDPAPVVQLRAVPAKDDPVADPQLAVVPVTAPVAEAPAAADLASVGQPPVDVAPPPDPETLPVTAHPLPDPSEAESAAAAVTCPVPVESTPVADVGPIPEPIDEAATIDAIETMIATTGPVNAPRPPRRAMRRRLTLPPPRRLALGLRALPGRVIAASRALATLDPFALATLVPAALIALALVFGGWLAPLALASLTLFTFAWDRFGDHAAPAVPRARAPMAADRLSLALAAAHAGLLALGVFALSGGIALGAGAWLMCFLALGFWLGQVSNSNAHELIHRPDQRLRRIGAAIFASILFGHHTSAHRLVHHRFAATPDDPASADAGDGFWTWAPRAWIGSFVAGYEMERSLMRPRFGRKARVVHPYALQIGGSLACLVVIAALAGPGGVLVWLLLAAHAQIQLMLSDYVQHYGLTRRKLPDGRIEPVGARHSWNAPHVMSGLQMLHAPRHSDHHLHPGRAYPQLVISDVGVPMLPRSLPVMACIALVPPVWFRIMDPLVRDERRRSDRAQAAALTAAHANVSAETRAPAAHELVRRRAI